MNETTVTNELENPGRAGPRRVARAHVFSVLTDPQVIPEWWGNRCWGWSPRERY
jgi:hypothetical protein